MESPEEKVKSLTEENCSLRDKITQLKNDYQSLLKKYNVVVNSNYVKFDDVSGKPAIVSYGTKDWSEDDVVSYLKGQSLVSQTLQINELMKEIIETGKNVYKFGFGESPFPIPQVCVEELKNNAHKNSYTKMNGLLSLRKACCAHMKGKFNVDHFTPDNVMVGVGSKCVLGDVQRVLNCEVLIPSPSWVTYLPQTVIAQRACTMVPCTAKGNYWPTADAIEKICKDEPNKRRLLILNSPSNPTGVRMTLEECKKLIPVLKKYKIIVLSDEIYSLFHEDGKKPICFAQKELYPELTIVTNGLSKVIGAGGWRLGFGCFPKKLGFMVKYLRKLASNSFSCAPEPIQCAAIVALTPSKEIDDYLEVCRKILDPLRNWCYEKLKSIGVTCAKPNAAFYMFPNFEKYRKKLKEKYDVNDGPGMCKVFLKQIGVAVLPGKAFLRKDEELTVRVCLCDVDGKTAMDAAKVVLGKGGKIDEEFLKKYCSRMIEGFEKLCNFLTDL